MTHPASSPTTRELEASILLRDHFKHSVMLIALVLRKVLRGDAQPDYVVKYLKDTAEVYREFLFNEGYAAADREFVEEATERFLKACAQMPAKKDDRLFAFAAAEARKAFKVIGRISETEPYGVETEK